MIGNSGKGPTSRGFGKEEFAYYTGNPISFAGGVEEAGTLKLQSYASGEEIEWRLDLRGKELIVVLQEDYHAPPPGNGLERERDTGVGGQPCGRCSSSRP